MVVILKVVFRESERAVLGQTPCRLIRFLIVRSLPLSDGAYEITLLTITLEIG